MKRNNLRSYILFPILIVIGALVDPRLLVEIEVEAYVLPA